MNPIFQMIKEAVSSKKFIMTVAAVIAAWTAKIGLDLPTETVALLIAPIVTYVLAQGWSDAGKGAAKVEAVAKVVTDDARLNTADTVEAIKNT